jgi:hypothetical protein
MPFDLLSLVKLLLGSPLGVLGQVVDKLLSEKLIYIINNEKNGSFFVIDMVEMYGPGNLLYFPIKESPSIGHAIEQLREHYENSKIYGHP